MRYAYQVLAGLQKCSPADQVIYRACHVSRNLVSTQSRDDDLLTSERVHFLDFRKVTLSVAKDKLSTSADTYIFSVLSVSKGKLLRSYIEGERTGVFEF